MLDEADFPSLILSWDSHPFPDLGTLSSKKEGCEASSSPVVLGNTSVSFLVPNEPGVFLRQRKGELFRSYLELLITQAGNPHYLMECQQPPQSGLEECYVHRLHKRLQDPLLPRADQTLLHPSLQPPWSWRGGGGGALVGRWHVCNHRHGGELMCVFSVGKEAGSSEGEGPRREEDSHGDVSSLEDSGSREKRHFRAVINPYSALCLPAGRVPKVFSSPKL